MRRANRQDVRALMSLTLLIISFFGSHSHAADSLQVVNVMPAFWALQEETGPAQTSEQAVLRFRQTIIEPNWAIYSKDQFKKNVTDEGIAAYLEQVRPNLEVMRALSARIDSQTAAASKRFAEAFPEFDGKVSITYLPSFYRFDGHVTMLDGQPAILFGLDGIAKYHGEHADLSVLFSHELFHIHHARTSPTLFADEENAPLYIGVWIEGLATYASEQLNPQASQLQILLDDQALLDRGMPLVDTIASQILARLDSTKPEDTGRFLGFGDQGDIPGRGGYLVGYLIAKNLGSKLPLSDLASLKGETLRNLVRKEMERLAAR